MKRKPRNTRSNFKKPRAKPKPKSKRETRNEPAPSTTTYTRISARESNRLKDAERRRILDEAARSRRNRKAIEALELDNYHEDPHADLVMSKKIPKFHDTLRAPNQRRGRRKTAEYFRNKYRKTLPQLIEEDKHTRHGRPNYTTAQAPVPLKPARHFCAVCGNFSNYTCTTCGARYCCIACLGAHRDTRCLKWTS